MLIQINTDNNIVGSEETSATYKTLIENALSRFSNQITRVEVHLSDENSHKENPDNKRCMLEARIKGLQPIAVTHQAENLDFAIRGATDKMKRSLDTTLNKLKNH